MLLCLLKSGEELSDLLKETPERVLLRWINYHLSSSGFGCVHVSICLHGSLASLIPRPVMFCCNSATVEAFGESLKDGTVLAALVRALVPEYCADVPAPSGKLLQ
jgi:hypothetical protein